MFISIFLDNKAAADLYVERKRNILPIQYGTKELKRVLHAQAKPITRRIKKLQVKIEKQDEALNVMRKDMLDNGLTVTIHGSDSE